MASVTFDGVSKVFGGRHAVNHLNLRVEDGEFLVLVGPSGCGKSTTLRMLAGLEEVSEGRIFIGEREVNHVPPRDRNIAMVFQSYALYPHMSVRQNMAFGLSLKGMMRDEIDRRVTDAARTLDIEALLSRKPGQLSGGQRQRVALGRAIVREPDVFLLDEPLSNLDAKLRVQTRAEIIKLHQRLGVTFVYVTHDQVEAMTMAERIAVLNEGALEQVGTPKELYDRPRSMFVASFIGSPAMNFVPAHVESVAEGLVLRSDGIEIALSSEAAIALAAHTGRDVWLGLRPEDIRDVDFVPSGLDVSTFTARVELAETMGYEVILHLDSGGQRLIARVDPRTSARPGHDAQLAVTTNRIYAFDPESERRLFPAAD